MKYHIMELLNDKIEDVFLELQDELEIEDGDIQPSDYFKLNELLEELATHIETVVKYQKGGC